MAARKNTTATTKNVQVENVESNINESYKTMANDVTNTNVGITDELLFKENENLKRQIIELQNQYAALLSTINNSTAGTEEYADIAPLKPIKVISLSSGGVTLRSGQNGTGKIFRFDKLGHAISIAYSDLLDVIATNRSFIENGVVYICDKDVIRNNYLTDAYKKFLTLDQITKILEFSVEDIDYMIRNTTKIIQETIVDVVVDKINNGESVDMNKILTIGNACTPVCDIVAVAATKRNS